MYEKVIINQYYNTREKNAHFVAFFFARCARKLMSDTLASSEILEFGLFTSPFNQGVQSTYVGPLMLSY